MLKVLHRVLSECVYMDMNNLFNIGFLEFPIDVFEHVNTRPYPIYENPVCAGWSITKETGILLHVYTLPLLLRAADYLRAAE